ncbi:MAG: CpaF family protein [Phycisphaerales bacterium]|nr:MAG: CpaF family protein [Phycisphaerales bacterium]
MFGKVKSIVTPKSADEPPPKGSASTGTVAPVVEPPPPTPEPPKRSAAEAKAIDDRVRAYNELKTRIHRKLVEKLDLQRLSGSDEQIRDQVRKLVASLTEQENALLNFNERQRLVEEVLDETFGLGPLEVLLADPSISDILVNGSAQIYVERAGKLDLTDVRFRDDAHLMHVIDKIVSAVGRRCDEVSPMVDARLNDGSRVNAIIGPLAIDGPSLSIRRFGTDPIDWDDYERLKSCPRQIRDFLEACVISRLNILIVGGTGSGKTTLLNNLSSFIPCSERIVTIEDAAELQLRQPHVVRLESRPPNIEGKGRITIRDLLINSLRMRPDRIVVGECRGPETLDMLQAMNTGHDGSLTTVHANNTRDAMQRVETMVMMAGFDLPTRAIRQQFSSAIDLIVQAQRLTGGRRKVTSVAEVLGMEGDAVTMQDIFVFEQIGVDKRGRAYGRHVATGIRPTVLERLKTCGCNVDTSVFERQVLCADEDVND